MSILPLILTNATSHIGFTVGRGRQSVFITLGVMIQHFSHAELLREKSLSKGIL